MWAAGTFLCRWAVRARTATLANKVLYNDPQLHRRQENGRRPPTRTPQPEPVGSRGSPRTADSRV